jgi:hypothetical protein
MQAELVPRAVVVRSGSTAPPLALTGKSGTAWNLRVGHSFAKGPEVRLWAVTTPSGVFQSEVVVHCVVEFLLAAKITLSCLHRSVPQQKLNLLKFSASQVA